MTASVIFSSRMMHYPLATIRAAMKTGLMKAKATQMKTHAV
jgi:hypothetical protein